MHTHASRPIAALTLLLAAGAACSASPTEGEQRSAGEALTLGTIPMAKDQSFLAPKPWGQDLLSSTNWNASHPRFVAEVSGDTKQDLVGFGDAGVYTALSSGSSFGPEVFVQAQFGTSQKWDVGRDIRTLVDLNHDGRADIVGFGDDGVWTALSAGAGASFAPARFVIGDLGYNQGWRVGTHERVLGDVNHDGNADIVAFGDGAVMLALGDGTGGFATPRAVLYNFITSQGWTAAKHVRTLADINNDQRDDIVAFGDDGVWIALSTGTGFAAPQFVLSAFGYNAGTWRVERDLRVLADLDRDGKKDIVAFGDDGVWVANATGTGFTAPALVIGDFGYNQGWRVDTNPRFVKDLNNDGYLDILGYGAQAEYRVLGGPAGWGPTRSVLHDFTLSTDWRTVGDVDGDGNVDLLDVGSAHDTVALGSTVPPPAPPAAPTNVRAIAKTTSSLTMAWDDNATNEVDYLVARWACYSRDINQKCGSVGPTYYTKLAANSTQVTLSGLDAGTFYFITVQAEGEYDVSPVALGDAGVPPFPPTLELIDITNTSITAHVYETGVMGLYTGGGPGNVEQMVWADDVTRVYSGLQPGTLYCMTASAVGDGEDSSWVQKCAATTTGTQQGAVDLEIQEVALDTYFPLAGTAINVSWTECFTASPPSYSVQIKNDSTVVTTFTRSAASLAGLPTGCYSSSQLPNTPLVTTTALPVGMNPNHYISVTADPGNVVPETNEQNNSTQSGYTSEDPDAGAK